MQVVRIITRLNVGGPSIQAISLTTALAPLGYETLLVHGALGPGEGDMRYLIDRSAQVEFVESLKRPIAPLGDLRAVLRIFRILRRTRPAILHTHMAKAGMLGRLAALAYNRLPGRPRVRVVHTYHGHVLEGYFSKRATRVFIQAERVLARATDAIIVISGQIRRELLEDYQIGRPEQYYVVPLGFELQAFARIDRAARTEARLALGIPASAPVVTTVGRLTAIKRHEMFLDVARRVAVQHPDAIFLIAGDGELRADLEARARALGAASQVRFLGWRRDLSNVYAATDVFALTSINEGTPVALIEAMASGVPGVATMVGGVPDVIARPELGVLVPSGNPAAMAAAIERLIDDPELRQRMGAAGRTDVLGRYHQERLVRDIVGVYEQLLQQR